MPRKLTQDEKSAAKALKSAATYAANAVASAINSIKWSPNNPVNKVADAVNGNGITPALIECLMWDYGVSLSQEDVAYVDTLVGFNTLANPDTKWVCVSVSDAVYYVMTPSRTTKAYASEELPGWVSEGLGMLKLVAVGAAVSHVGYRIADNIFYVLHRGEHGYEDGANILSGMGV